MRFIKKSENGFGVVEIIFAVSIVAIFVVSIISINVFYARISSGEEALIKASFLAEEGIEALKFMRDESWTSNISPLSTNGTKYYLIFDNGWVATTTPQMEDGFERSFVLSAICRNSSGDIDVCGNLDTGTRLLEMNVSWLSHNGTTTKTMKAYLSDIFDN